VNTPDRTAALCFVAWARVFSPVAAKDLRSDAWKALGLPGDFGEVEGDYWAIFHVGSPPPVPLVFHAALGMEGGHAREEWMRVLQFLGLAWQDAALPPDHLAPGCEALAAAIDKGDRVMVAELCERYLQPWCEQAHARLAEGPQAMRELVGCFEGDLQSVAG
jgi:TorA maturation chaperone TorD